MTRVSLTKADIPRLEELFAHIQKLNGKDIFENMAIDDVSSLVESELLERYKDKFNSKPHRNFLFRALFFVDNQVSKRGGVESIMPLRASKESLEYRLVYGEGFDDFNHDLYEDAMNDADYVVSGETTPEQFIEKYASIYAEIVESKIVK